MTRQKSDEPAKAVRPPVQGGLAASRRSALAVAARSPKKSAGIKHARPAPAAQSSNVDLQLQLDKAEARVKELEIRLATLANQIAWVADRLHGLLEGDR